MDIAVLMKHVPDLVEELEIDEDTGRLDRTFLRLVPSEMDDHALEQAILLKERLGGTVTVLALDGGEVEDTLYTASAKGADRVIRITGNDPDEEISNRAAAAVFDTALQDVSFDLLLTGTQATDDLDGSVGSIFAARRDLPYVGYVTAVEAKDDAVELRKEYPGGLLANMRMELPGVVGVQAAEQPPRYVVTSLVMEAMKNATIDESEQVPDGPVLDEGIRLRPPEPAGRAEILEGDADEIAELLVGLMRERGILAGGGQS
jgi:electron transfer flavoprotein beta subunit